LAAEKKIKCNKHHISSDDAAMLKSKADNWINFLSFFKELIRQCKGLNTRRIERIDNELFKLQK